MFRRKKKNPRYICPVCLEAMTGDKEVDKEEHAECIEKYLTRVFLGPHSELW